ncbi:hypothetical protein ACH0B5_08545 [Ureibacillus sp. 179-F W5.1 NHS]|uniref:Uncharacterized protein n=1 Tax=Lysinibacillus halotolerans TaxID=1368476 RepID=A0A3M8H6Y3_9BACI|nr:hypothetical protein [Lysinibacillus halotolerans]RNC98039.1 hypothetical protein EC501_12610 [Lysinibacillus halotolerans]
MKFSRFSPLKNISLWFYLCSLVLYFISFIGAFTVGLYIIFGAIVSLLFGLSVSLKILTKERNPSMILTISIFIVAISFILWYLLVHYIDDVYIFYPFSLFNGVN